MPVEDPVFSGDQVRHDGFGTFYEPVKVKLLILNVIFLAFLASLRLCVFARKYSFYDFVRIDFSEFLEANVAKYQSNLIRSREDTKALMQVAKGNMGADLALINARVLNVYTGELLENYSVCIWNKWIAYVGGNPDGSIQENTRVLDMDGKTLIPGLIDGHTHLAWLSTPEAFLKHAAISGTTTIITETLEPYPVAGLDGVIDFLESLRDQPIKIFATAPPMVSTSKAATGISMADLNKLLERDDIVGLGESYWQAVLQEPDRYLPLIAGAQQSGKTAEGHSAGAGEKKLMSYLVTGISSCHEPITSQEALERLRLGLYVMVREGSIRRDLEAISKINDTGIDLRRLILVSDGIEPGDLLENGYMEWIVQKAIDLGFDPIAAIQMATINAAEHFKLDHLIGGIGPGRYADLLVVPDEKTIEPVCVISNGKIIAENGKLLKPVKPHRFSHMSRHSIRLSRKIAPEDFNIQIPGDRAEVTIRAIDMVTDLVTREHIITLPCRDGKVRIDPGDDILQIAAVDRTFSPGKTFTGFIHGFGLKAGALACSAAWDTSDIIVVGTNTADMALAVNRIHHLQGGAVLCKNGSVIEELPLPIFGIMSDLPLEEIDRKINAISEHAHRLGVPFPDPLLSLITLTGAAIPFLRICEEGLVNLKDGKIVDLFVSE